MKETAGSKRVSNISLPNFIKVKNREIFDKKIAETFINYFVNIDPNLVAFIPESKTTFQNYIHYDGHQYHQSYRLRSGKCICESQNKQKFRV